MTREEREKVSKEIERQIEVARAKIIAAVINFYYI